MQEVMMSNTRPGSTVYDLHYNMIFSIIPLKIETWDMKLFQMQVLQYIGN